jgi:outer membrane protein assembly factor BamC
MAYRVYARRGLLTALALTSLAGCSTLNSLTGSLSGSLQPDQIDYKSAGKVTTRSLEIPPDLTQLRSDNRYAIPAAGGSATASTYNLQAGPAGARPAVAVATVAPKATPTMRIERNGNQRYLVISQTPEALWPQLKDFWQELGFLINVDQQQAGVMETDWAENRAKIPQDFIRNSLGRVLDSLYSTSERDKFRTRLERGADGTTEIYISHRGSQEVLSGREKDSTVWTARPSDPELEAEFLARLMTRLGTEATQAKTAVASAAPAPARARLVKAPDGEFVQVEEDFDRAWRRVGLALDRVGFTVEDRDRTLGLYFVRYVDDAAVAGAAQRGFFSRLFTRDSNDSSTAEKFRVSVKGTGNASRISVLNGEGKASNSATADKILTLLNDQLK